MSPFAFNPFSGGLDVVSDLSGHLKLDQTPTPQTTVGNFSFPSVSITAGNMNQYSPLLFGYFADTAGYIPIWNGSGGFDSDSGLYFGSSQLQVPSLLSSDGISSVTINDGTYAINATGPSYIDGDVTLNTVKNKGTIGTDANGKIVAGSVGTYTRTLQMFGDMRGLYIVSADWILLNMDRAASTYPSGVTITRVYVDCSTASPTTQLTGKLKYCDALGGGAFPGASPTDIVTLTTTTGNYDSGAISTSVGANKIIYLEMTADPTDYNTTWNICVSYTVN
jgi:hypothetical protein